MSLNSVKKMWFTEKGDEACTEFGDKKGNSQNSVMNSSQAGIAHIYDEIGKAFTEIAAIIMNNWFLTFIESHVDRKIL